jgi:hypothetical protein
MIFPAVKLNARLGSCEWRVAGGVESHRNSRDSLAGGCALAADRGLIETSLFPVLRSHGGITQAKSKAVFSVIHPRHQHPARKWTLPNTVLPGI